MANTRKFQIVWDTDGANITLPETEVKPPKVKHQKLAGIMLRKGWHTWYAISEYISRYARYDSWTIRDIDQVYKLIK